MSTLVNASNLRPRYFAAATVHYLADAAIKKLQKNVPGKGLVVLRADVEKTQSLPGAAGKGLKALKDYFSRTFENEIPADAMSQDVMRTADVESQHAVGNDSYLTKANVAKLPQYLQDDFRFLTTRAAKAPSVTVSSPDGKRVPTRLVAGTISFDLVDPVMLKLQKLV